MSPIGILAGSGGLVKAVIAACKREARPYFIIAFEDQSDPDFIKEHPHVWVGLGQVGKVVTSLKQAGVQDLVLAGAFKRPSFSSLKTDFMGARWLAQLIGKSMGDDALLRFIMAKLEGEGFQIVAAEALVGATLLGGAGLLTKKAPSKEHLLDIKRGLAILDALSESDVGQAVVIQEGLVLGIEAVEGTQALVTRTGEYKRTGRHAPLLIKAFKRAQDGRADRPTLGTQTIEALEAAGFAGVAFEAGEVILLDQDAMVEAANKKDLFVYGFTRG